MRACPHEHWRRSRRRPGERLFAVLRLQPYRCTLCHKRQLRYTGRPWLELPALLMLVFAAGYLYWFPPPQQQSTPGQYAVSPGAPLDASDTSGASAKVEPAVELRADAQQAHAVPTAAATVMPEPPSEREVQQASQMPANADVAADAGEPLTAGREPETRLPTLRALDIEQDAKRFVLSIAHSEGEFKPRLARLAKPDRLIMDLAGHWDVDARLLKRRDLTGPIVQRVRFGQHEEKLRIVLDLQTVQGVRQRLVSSSGQVELTLVLD